MMVATGRCEICHIKSSDLGDVAHIFEGRYEKKRNLLEYSLIRLVSDDITLIQAACFTLEGEIIHI